MSVLSQDSVKTRLESVVAALTVCMYSTTKRCRGGVQSAIVAGCAVVAGLGRYRGGVRCASSWVIFVLIVAVESVRGSDVRR